MYHISQQISSERCHIVYFWFDGSTLRVYSYKINPSARLLKWGQVLCVRVRVNLAGFDQFIYYTPIILCYQMNY